MDRRAAIGRALNARKPVSSDPEFLALTEDERENGLALFGAETGSRSEEHETFERTDALVATAAPTHRIARRAKPRVPPEAWTETIRQAPFLAPMLTVAVVLFGAAFIQMMRSTPDARLSISSEPAVRRTAPAPDTVRPAFAGPRGSSEVAVAVPAVVLNDLSEAPVRPAPVTPAVREAPPERIAPPIRAAAAIAPPVPPLPVPDSPIAPAPLVSSEKPASVAVEASPIADGPRPRPRDEPSASAPLRLPAPETAIQTALGRYRAAYQALDAGAARAVWPRADTKALRKAFEGLEEQELVFDSCQVSVSDARAMASCRGIASYVPRFGSRSRRDDQRQWDFTLTKVDDAWLIDTVVAR